MGVRGWGVRVGGARVGVSVARLRRGPGAGRSVARTQVFRQGPRSLNPCPNGLIVPRHPAARGTHRPEARIRPYVAEEWHRLGSMDGPMSESGHPRPDMGTNSASWADRSIPPGSDGRPIATTPGTRRPAAPAAPGGPRHPAASRGTHRPDARIRPPLAERWHQPNFMVQSLPVSGHLWPDVDITRDVGALRPALPASTDRPTDLRNRGAQRPAEPRRPTTRKVRSGGGVRCHRGHPTEPGSLHHDGRGDTDIRLAARALEAAELPRPAERLRHL